MAVLSVSVPQARAMLAQYHDFLIRKAMADGKSQQRAEADLARSTGCWTCSGR